MKFYSHRTLVNTFAGRTMPTHARPKPAKEIPSPPTHGEREIKKMPHAQVEKMKEYE